MYLHFERFLVGPIISLFRRLCAHQKKKTPDLFEENACILANYENNCQPYMVQNINIQFSYMKRLGLIRLSKGKVPIVQYFIVYLIKTADFFHGLRVEADLPEWRLLGCEGQSRWFMNIEPPTIQYDVPPNNC